MLIKQFSRRVLQRDAMRQLDLVAMTAFSLLAHSHGALASAGNFLAEVDDECISRPMLDIKEVDAMMYLTTRAGKSLDPMELSPEAAKTIDDALANRSARPTFTTSRLPEIGQ